MEQSADRFKQVRRGASGNQDPSAKKRLASEHVELEGEIEKDFHEETYGSNAMRMMEKMGYKAGSGLGKEKQGRTSLLGSCVALEHTSGTSALGFSHYAGAIRLSAAERAARLADARAKKCQKVENACLSHCQGISVSLFVVLGLCMRMASIPNQTSYKDPFPSSKQSRGGISQNTGLDLFCPFLSCQSWA